LYCDDIKMQLLMISMSVLYLSLAFLGGCWAVGLLDCSLTTMKHFRIEAGWHLGTRLGLGSITEANRFGSLGFSPVFCSPELPRKEYIHYVGEVN